MKEIEENQINVTPVCSTPKWINQSLWNQSKNFIQSQNFTTNNTNDIDIDTFNSFFIQDQKREDETTLKRNEAENPILDKIEFTLVKTTSKIPQNNSTNSLKHTSAEERQRETANNKAVVRAIRRLYLGMFKNQNHKLVK